MAGWPQLKPSYQHLRNPPPRMCHHSLGPGHARISIASCSCLLYHHTQAAHCCLTKISCFFSQIAIHTPELRCPSGQRPLLTSMVFYAMSPEEMGQVPCLLCFVYRGFCKYPVCICMNNKYVHRCCILQVHTIYRMYFVSDQTLHQKGTSF